MKSLFLIIGAPGSGKTTDAQIIAKEDENFVHFSTGDLLRNEIATQSELGKTIASFTDKGELVPIEIVLKAIVEAIEGAAKSKVIIDGYPRSKEQMLALDNVLQIKTDIKLKAVVEVEVSKEVAMQRVLGRSRGKDDNETVFENRMRVYTEPLKEIQDFYTQKQILHKVDAHQSIPEVVADIINIIQDK